MDTQKQFNITCLGDLDDVIIKGARDAAERRLASLLDLNNRIEHKSGILLGWLVAAIIAMLAFIVMQSPSGWPTPLIMAIYGVLMLALPAFILIRGIHFKQGISLSGMKPEIYLGDDILKRIVKDKAKGPEIQRMDADGYYLIHLNEAAKNNEKRLREWIKTYRTAVTLLSSGIAIGVMLLVALWIWR